jgi:hypothetical protein
MFCVVSWHNEARDLAFWGGEAWGVSSQATFFKTRPEATMALAGLLKPGDAFREPNVVDVAAFNKKFRPPGMEIGPKPKTEVSTSFDPETGILTRAHHILER